MRIKHNNSCGGLLPRTNRYTAENFGKLMKLDIVMKESMRMHSGGVGPGTFLFSPTNALSHDPNLFPEPKTFDGLRFYKQRISSNAEANRHQLTTIDNTTTYFGAGRHACPGRAFAIVEANVILVELLKRYDFMGIEGVEAPRDNQYLGLLSVNHEKEILMRHRADV